MALLHSVKLTWHLENGELEDDPFLLGQKAFYLGAKMLVLGECTQ